MVEVFREVRRVLRDDGVCWLNYADCFIDGQLALMPHRLAIALQQDGWIVRNDLVWFKRNPMPESVAGWRWERKRTKAGERTREQQRNDDGSMPFRSGKGVYGGDESFVSKEYEYGDDYVLRKSSWRHTRSHEYVFMLVKKPKYYCNQEVVREAQAESMLQRTDSRPIGEKYQSGDGKEYPKNRRILPSGRNPHSVLDVPTAPYKGAHYATFPPKLIAPLIRASVSRRCCPECGMAWAPVVEKQIGISKECPKTQSSHEARGGTGTPIGTVGKSGSGRTDGHTSVTDYYPTCECEHQVYIPGVVLDIFGGSGTTGAVAKQLMRRWVVMDISRPYLDEQAKVRTGTGTPSKALEGLPMFEEMP